MLTPIQLLRARGVQIFLDPRTGQLRHCAPADALTAEVREIFDEVVLEYEERAAILEYGAGMDRASAGRVAAEAAIAGASPIRPLGDKPWRPKPWHPRPRRGNGSPLPIIPRIIKGVSAVDDLRQQIEELKAKAAQVKAKPGTAECAVKPIDYAKEIRHLEEIIGALQKLYAATAAQMQGQAPAGQPPMDPAMAQGGQPMPQAASDPASTTQSAAPAPVQQGGATPAVDHDMGENAVRQVMQEAGIVGQSGAQAPQAGQAQAGGEAPKKKGGKGGENSTIWPSSRNPWTVEKSDHG